MDIHLYGVSRHAAQICPAKITKCAEKKKKIPYSLLPSCLFDEIHNVFDNLVVSLFRILNFSLSQHRRRVAIRYYVGTIENYQIS